MSEKELRAMIVSDWGYIDDFTKILRVPTGWIYYRMSDDSLNHYPNGTFVPLYTTR